MHAAVRCVTGLLIKRSLTSASFDRFIRLWDTETGQCIRTFTNRKMPYCVTFNPKDPNIFLVGSSDNKVLPALNKIVFSSYCILAACHFPPPLWNNVGHIRVRVLGRQ